MGKVWQTFGAIGHEVSQALLPPADLILRENATVSSKDEDIKNHGGPLHHNRDPHQQLPTVSS